MLQELRIAFFSVLFAMLCLAFCSTAALAPLRPIAAEMESRDALIRAVSQLVENGGVDALDSLGVEFRDGEVRTRSGAWKLTLFYNAIEDVAARAGSDPQLARRLLETIAAWRQAYPDHTAPVLAEAIAVTRLTIARGNAPSFQPVSLIPASLIPVSLIEDDDGQLVLRALLLQLETHRAELSVDPHAFVVTANVALATGAAPGTVAEIINSGIARHPGYYALYFTAMDQLLKYEQPGPDKINAIAEKASEATRVEEGFSLYARLMWHATSQTFGPRMIASPKVDWQRMRLGIGDVLDRYPDPWNVNNFAYLACLAGDREVTVELLAQVGGEPIGEAWHNLAVYQRCVDWAKGSTSGNSGVKAK